MACVKLATLKDLGGMALRSTAPPAAPGPDGQDTSAISGMLTIASLGVLKSPSWRGTLGRDVGLELEDAFHSLCDEQLAGVFPKRVDHGPDVFVPVGDHLLVLEVKSAVWKDFTRDDKAAQARELDAKLRDSRTVDGVRQGTAEHTQRHVLRLIDHAEKNDDPDAADEAVLIQEALEADKVRHFGVALSTVEKPDGAVDFVYDVYPLDDEGEVVDMPRQLDELC